MPTPLQNVRSMALDQLHPAPYNPRRQLTPQDPEYHALRRSIEKFGNVQPIIWNMRTGYVVGGHQRLTVLRDMGVAETDVVIVDMSEADERALNVALNKVEGEWDMPKLAEVLAGLKEEGGEELMTLSGYSPSEAEALLAQITTPNFAPVVEPEINDSTVTAEEINAARERMEGRFAGNNTEIRQVMCPECGHEFGINQ